MIMLRECDSNLSRENIEGPQPERPPFVVNWDELDAERIGLFPPKPSRLCAKPSGAPQDRFGS